jgi:hypothetical protein
MDNSDGKREREDQEEAWYYISLKINSTSSDWATIRDQNCGTPPRPCYCKYKIADGDEEDLQQQWEEV